MSDTVIIPLSIAVATIFCCMGVVYYVAIFIGRWRENQKKNKKRKSK